MFYIEQKLTPFGLLLETQEARALADIPVDDLRALVDRNRLVALRGFGTLDRQEFVDYAKTWGALLEWNFGEVLELEVSDQPKNYLFTSGDVPLHWDGAFAEQEPNYQVFQCLKAPSPGSGGQTVFCEAVEPLRRAPASWSEVAITYRTEKLAHYGGEIRSSLVTPNPKTGENRIRFAEPPGKDTADLNPLALEIEGARDSIIDELREILYHPDYCYQHQWQDGDFLVADNLTLLHGRRPFSAHSPRHIQRIHVL